MRRLAVVALLLAVAVAGACGPKPVTAPIVTTPKFPDFIRPPVPPELAGDRAAAGYDRAWRFLQAGDLRNAERELTAVLSLSPAFYPAHAAMGYLELAKKDPKAALEHFDEALSKDAASAAAENGRGAALAALDRDAEAIAAFDAAVALDPSLSDVRRRSEVLKFKTAEHDLAVARELAGGNKLDEAARAYKTAIAGSPDSPFLYRELGAVERRQGDREAALATFRQAVALDSSDAVSLGQIGDLLDESGDPTAALEAYDRALGVESNAEVGSRRAALVARMELARLPEEYRAIDGADQITRADLAALIGVRLAKPIEAAGARDLGVVTDIRNSWAQPWIMSVTRAGVMELLPNHTFQPQAIVQRADLAQAASRLIEIESPPALVNGWRAARVTFTDLVETHLAYPSAALAVAAGIMSAAADGSFQPSRIVTGAEAVQAIERLQAMSVAPRR